MGEDTADCVGDGALDVGLFWTAGGPTLGVVFLPTVVSALATVPLMLLKSVQSPFTTLKENPTHRS